MTATYSDRQRQPATEPLPDDGDPQLARARDADATPRPAGLPDTQRVERVVSDWADGFRDSAKRIWSGEVWDIQPPSPRELIDRGRDSVWADSDSRLKAFLAWMGVALALAWSVPWYTLAVAGQRFGRAFITFALLVLIKFLL